MCTCNLRITDITSHKRTSLLEKRTDKLDPTLHLRICRCRQCHSRHPIWLLTNKHYFLKRKTELFPKKASAVALNPKIFPSLKKGYYRIRQTFENILFTAVPPLLTTRRCSSFLCCFSNQLALNARNSNKRKLKH